MADLSDVENALVAFVNNVIHPSGAGGATTIGAPCEVSRGWPNKIKLGAALAAGKAMATVYAVPGTEKLTSRFPRAWQVKTPAVITLSAVVLGNVITLAGTVTTAPQVVTVRANNVLFTYVVLVSDTLSSIATALAALIPGAAALGAAITVVGGQELYCRVSGQGTLIAEMRRQQRSFQVSLWCPTPTVRDVAASLVDSAFAAISTLTLADGFAAMVYYSKTMTSDMDENANLYRRDLIFQVEYATTATQNAWTVSAIPLTITNNYGPYGNAAPAVFDL